jgi:hypothetical protein
VYLLPPQIAAHIRMLLLCTHLPPPTAAPAAAAALGCCCCCVIARPALTALDSEGVVQLPDLGIALTTCS